MTRWDRARLLPMATTAAADVRSILSVGGAAPTPRPAGQALVLTAASVPTRSLQAYRIGGEQL
jgi:hypothetical protein